jgi:hypothetical protein
MNRHRRGLGPLVLLASLAAAGIPASPVAAQTSAFSYRPERAPAVGTVWHYTKSNRDGSEPWHLDAFLASPTRVEVVKWVEGASDFVEVHADLDFARAMPAVLEQWNTTAAGREPTLAAVLPATVNELRLAMANGQSAAVPYAAGPLHVWGFDLMSLHLALPHLVAPDRSFEVTFLDPNRPGADGAPFLVDRARFTPAGDETAAGVACRRYELAGPVFGGATGAVWVAKADGTLVQAEHAIPTSTDWRDFRLTRVGTETMGTLDWERFKLGLAAAVAKASGGARGPSAAAAMKAAYEQGGLTAALAAGDAARANLTRAFEADLNTFGYTLLGFGKVDDAVAVFSRATVEFPASANAWDSLGEALAAAGRTAEAVAAYRQSLALDAANQHAVDELGRLGATP